MRSIFWTGSICALAILAGTQHARADNLKSGLFVLGIHMGGAEGVAAEFRGIDTSLRPGGMGLIKRNLKWSADLADALKLDSAPLKSLLAEVDRLTFADIEGRLARMRVDFQGKFSREINPGAAAPFILGIHQSGAERIALQVSGFERRDKPGSAGLIERNLGWMKSGAEVLKLSVAPVTKAQRDLATGAGFASLAGQLEAIRLLWQKELMDQPGYGAGTGPGVVIFNQAGQLTKGDRFDRERKAMYAKVHDIHLSAGKTYVIDLESGNGNRGNIPTWFDTWLRIEDAAGKTLATNDDVGGGSYNSRITFQPPQDAMYRLIVTSYSAGATGSYTLTVRQK